MTGHREATMVMSMLSLCVTSAGCKHQSNPVVDYLDGAEVQYEGEQQRQNIVEALEDAMRLPPGELEQRRYRDYRGNEQRWDLREVIEHHFVPDAQGKGLGPDLYRDITSREGRDEVAEILESL